MLISVLMIGIILDVIWLLITYISEEKTKLFLILGGLASVMLCVYTQEFITFIIMIVVGAVFGLVGNGYRQHTLERAQEEKGLATFCVMCAIFLLNIFLVIALSCPGQNIFPWS